MGDEIKEMKKFCLEHEFCPWRQRGQNFLINNQIVGLIVQVAQIDKDDVVLEIGPGFGVLTEGLIQKAKKVIAVEIDKKLTTFLNKKFALQKNIKIIQDDVLKLKPETFNLKSSEYKLVANLPYQITGAVLRKFLASEFPKTKLIILMVQKEVAEKILEKNGKSSIISLMVALYGQFKIIKYISKNNFWPKPKIDSALIKIIPQEKFKTEIKDKEEFLKFIKKGFVNPRKQLINNLARCFPKETLKEKLDFLKIDQQIRAEDLNLKNWLKIYQQLYEG